MIRFVTGLPGSGKSYYAVNFIAKYGEYDPLYQTFIVEKDLKVFTNLEDLQIAHESLDVCYQKYGGAEKFFTCANFIKIREVWPKGKILIIIDEAQNHVDDDLLKNKDVAFFFQFHRHYGIDIFLLTNDILSCSGKTARLAENIIEAQPRSVSLPGVFRYKFMDKKGTFLYSKSLKVKQSVFSIYKSFEQDEHEKPKNVILHWIVVLVVVLIVFVGSFKLFINSFFHKKKAPPAIATISKPIQRPLSSVRVLPIVAVAPVVYHHKRQSLLVKPLPVPVTVSAPLVASASVAGWHQGKLTGEIQINDHHYMSVDGHLLDANDCKRVSQFSDKVLCRVDSMAVD